MEVNVIHQIRGPQSSKVFILVISGPNDESKYSYSCCYPAMVVGNIAFIKFKFKREVGDKSFEQYIVSWISSSKRGLSEDKVIKMAVTCEEMGYSEQWNCAEHGIEWRKMGSMRHVSQCQRVCKYIIEVDINVCELESPLVKLYNDNVFTDFNLRTGEGSVTVHKACLASHSDMFKTMFGGKWKETEECCVEPEGVTLQTLQHLKDYLYLGSLPENGLRELLLIAMRYMIDSLKAKCILSLVHKVTQEELFDLLEFARENEIPELTLAIIQLTPNKVVENISESLKKLEVGEN